MVGVWKTGGKSPLRRDDDMASDMAKIKSLSQRWRENRPPAFRLPFKLTQGKWRERMLKNNGDLSIALSSHQSCQKLIDEPLSDKLSVARVCVFDGFEIYKLESFGP